MSRIWSFIELALDVSAAYQQVHRPQKRTKITAADALAVLAALLLLATVGLGLAAIFTATAVLGTAVACLLTGLSALALAAVSLGVSRLLLQTARE